MISSIRNWTCFYREWFSLIVMDITIRTATERDVPLILELIRGLAEYERLGHAVTATEAGLRQSLFGTSAPSAGVEVLIAEALGEPVGFALFFHNFSTFVGKRGLYLEDLFVKPDWRGRGVGRLLLVRLAQLAVERDCGRLEWAVLDWNEPAIRFYKGLGAQPMHDWTVFRVDGDALQQLAAERAETR
jgi:GNAT superfamily N-acetyltransferase